MVFCLSFHSSNGSKYACTSEKAERLLAAWTSNFSDSPALSSWIIFFASTMNPLTVSSSWHIWYIRRTIITLIAYSTIKTWPEIHMVSDEIFRPEKLIFVIDSIILSTSRPEMSGYYFLPMSFCLFSSAYSSPPDRAYSWSAIPTISFLQANRSIHLAGIALMP